MSCKPRQTYNCADAGPHRQTAAEEVQERRPQGKGLHGVRKATQRPETVQPAMVPMSQAFALL